MNIINMRKPREDGQWGKVKAFFSVAVAGFEMKDFKLVEGSNGLFASPPSRKGTDEQGNDKWFDTIWIDSREVREQLTNEAIKAYNNDMAPPASSSPSTDSVVSPMPSEESSGDNIKKDTSSSDASNDSVTPAFSDEDIPF